MKVLAIESSCDESAVAIVDSDKKIFAHLIKSQIIPLSFSSRLYIWKPIANHSSP